MENKNGNYFNGLCRDYIRGIFNPFGLSWTSLAFCPSLSLDHVAGLTLDWGLRSV